ncbi:terminase [Chelonobacter oris]|uniref:DUF1441 family protein n=1 Tax=Chelonobacter oris TaxID=505317 RepID=UPI00244A93A5|nr:DUF1441 family protein [Chelonobacter oris]MDH3001494.1 terminase [Chelonobacter oris]
MENLHEMKLNINQIADLVGMHRQTVSQRVAGLTPALGSNRKMKLYPLADLIRMGLFEKRSADVDSLPPADKRAFWQAENERIKYEEKIGELIPAHDVSTAMSILAKAVIQPLETMPDILESKFGLSPKAVQLVQNTIDDIRDQMAEHIIEALENRNTEDETE